MSTNKATTILKDDPRFVDVPDFRELRERGLAHVAALSGDLWTDHNLHDPGITILELLCYALTDLGYRTSLDEAELFAPAKAEKVDGNFFTPAEILTNNPVTILDFRKMLVDIPGVRNAWIEKAERQEVPLSYKVPSGQDCEARELLTRPLRGEREAEVQLSGLYRVLLDIDPRLTADRDGCTAAGNTFGATLSEVKRRLHAHRNLCEDFLEVSVLRDEEIAFCLDLDLSPKADPGTVLAEVFTAIENFISPRLRFATLGTLLAEGKPIEEIFRGRPYLPEYAFGYGVNAQSHGFVDTEQLAGLERPTELRASDLYRVIMAVEGVRGIRQLKLANFLGDLAQTDGVDWVLPLTEDHRPLFAPEKGSYTFYKGSLRVPFDPREVTARFRRRLGDYRKTPLGTGDLDLAIPYGEHRDDLGDYYSIQHELPTTYGVGEGDLPTSVSGERKAQMFQLRGFLTFFDQFLANYCAQLFNSRDVYTWLPGPGKTVFGQAVAGAPGSGELLRFPPTPPVASGPTPALVTNLEFFDHPLNRDQAVDSLIGEIRSLRLDELNARMSVVESADGTYHFEFADALGRPQLRGAEDFRVEESAKLAGEKVALQLIYQGGVAANYRKDNYPANHRYGFTILDGATNYETFLEEITETPAAFARNRDGILDHLLARFNEAFTDYALLMYALNQEALDSGKIIADKEAFLEAYPKISRERGKGMDYQQPGLTDNRSGLEQRVGYLMGLEGAGPDKLNPFTVHLRKQRRRLVWKDHRGRVFFRTAAAFPLVPAPADAGETSPSLVIENREAIEADLLKRLSRAEYYSSDDCLNEDVFAYALVDTTGRQLADFPVTHPSAELRDESLVCTRSYFGEPLNLSVEVYRQNGSFRFQIVGTVYRGEVADDQSFWRSEDSYSSRAEGKLAGTELVAAIRSGSAKITNFARGKKKEYGLILRGNGTVARSTAVVPTADERKILRDKLTAYHAALFPDCPGLRLQLCSEPRGYFLTLLGPDKEGYLRTANHYPNAAEARIAGLELLRSARIDTAYQSTAAGRYGFEVESAEGEMIGEHPATYANEGERDQKLGEVKKFFREHQFNYLLTQSPESYVWCVTAGPGGPSLISQVPFASERAATDNWELVRRDILQTASWEMVERSKNAFWLEVRRPEGLLLAESGPFPDRDSAAENRTKLRERIGLGIRDGESVLSLPRTWSFALLLDGEIVLRGEQSYPDREAADWAFFEFTKLASKPENYQERTDPDGCLLSFQVVNGQQVVAIHPHFLAESAAGALRNKVIAHVADRFIDCRMDYQEFHWTYQIKWENCSGHCATLLQSSEEGWPTAVAAKAAAKQLIQSPDLSERLEDWTRGDRYSFGISEEGVVLVEHPLAYATEAERAGVKADAAGYLQHYLDLCSGTKAGFFTEDELFVHCKSLPVCCTDEPEEHPEPAGGDCILSAYRLSDASAVAIHPTILRAGRERDELAKEIQEAGDRGALRYQEFSVSITSLPVQYSGDGARVPGTEVKSKVPIRFHYEWTVPDLPTFRSVRSFATEAEAGAGFDADLPWLLMAAKRAKFYESLDLGKAIERLQADCWPEDAPPYADHCPQLFEQAHCLALVNASGLPVVYLPKVKAADFAEKRRKWQHYAIHYPLRWTAGKGWSYHLVDPKGQQEWLRSAGYYSERVPARQAFEVLLELLQSPANYRPDDQPEAGIFRLEIIETLLEATITYADQVPERTDETPCPVICSAEYAASRYVVEDDSWPVLLECPDQPRVNPLCPKAWEEGLETFLLYGIEHENYYDFLDPGAACRHGFRVVQPGYRVARNPRESHTTAEREKLLAWLYQYGNCRLDKDDQPYEQCVSFGGDTYRPALKAEGGEIHWLGTERFESPKKAADYWKENMVGLLGYAQEPDYYQARKAVPDEDGRMRYRLELLNDASELVLESRDAFYREDIPGEVRSRVALARRFPIYLFRGKYGFQCFSTEDAPDFREPTDDPYCPNIAPAAAPFEEEAETNLFEGLLELNIRVPGEVTWESAEEFTGEDAAWAAYQCFLKLLDDRRNYQRTLLRDCNLFGIDLTRPDYVLAEHPRRYPGPETLAKAKERTLSRVNGEGMLLVEHLLLRPRSTEDATIPNICPAPPPESVAEMKGCPNRDRWMAEAPFPSLAAPKPGLEQVDNSIPVIPYVPGADPYSFWATIVLPYWPNRFQNVNFRAFFGDTLRREAPAHVALKICWLDPKQMWVFERRYRDWLNTLDREDDCGRGAAQDALVDFLAGMTSVYPPARLQAGECGAASSTEAGAVLLGSTQLS